MKTNNHMKYITVALAATLVLTTARAATPMVSAGGYHTVALKEDGTVWTWGDNYNGQLGDNTWISRYTPVQVKGEEGEGVLSNVVSVAAGGDHTVALKEDGTVWAWGDNDFGQIGDDTWTDKTTPVQVKGEGGVGWLSNIVAVAAGRRHTVAVKDDGTVWAWGWNYSGQLGNGTWITRYTPVQVDNGGLSNITAVAAGEEHTVALKDDGTVWAWGYNGSGRLGDGTMVDQNTPVQAKGVGGEGVLSNITAVAAGDSHTVVVKDDGTVWAYGLNSYGQLGDGTTTQRTTPVQAGGGGLSNIVAVVAGGLHTVALKSDGTVWAWGLNSSGQLGDGTWENKFTPVQVLGAGGEGMLYLLAEVQGVYVTAITVDGSRNVTLVLDGEAAGVTVEMSLDLSDPLGWSEVPSGLITPVSPNTIKIDAAALGSAKAAFFRVKGSL
ncbi:MAG: RCC1 repeat- and reductase domain-containing protein [Kiritimatiellaeota bacterium]|nr:RCC1 repeat- and reductase domain-containing protein [Kiritimatiellota bacterium]